MAEVFESVLLNAAYSDLTIQNEEYLDDSDEKMDIDWNIDCGNIETRSSLLVIEFGASPYLSSRLDVEVCKTKHEDGIQTLDALPTTLRHYPLDHPAAPLGGEAVYVSAVGNHRRGILSSY
ncbi:hypothetical protein Y032_0030g2087 [Ancylostoma ceylanicum]|uniref:Uncharacterized protein n=1 Tax=Ancylostoma ceylanicum TaxID=53326 RepID=A0A016UQ11_9BILA|nr:hypothetical protein Y032_0030g2087 [Ancylostoma ceylanicum]